MSVRRFVFLVGLSGSGKSTVGFQVAVRLRMPFYDLDDEVERRAGRSIGDIFHEAGEAAFRDMESEVLKQLVQGPPAVVATGGGVVTRPENIALLRDHGWVVFLNVRPDTAAQRVMTQQRALGSRAYRPLIGTTNPLSRVRELFETRLPLYLSASHWIVSTDEMPDWAVTAAVVHGITVLEGRSLEPVDADGHLQISSPLGATGQRVVLGSALIQRLGELAGAELGDGRVFVITDELVSVHWMPLLGKALGGRTLDVLVVPAGERSKSLRTAQLCYNWLADHRAERRDCILALGGGMVGDLAGYVASTYLRGLPLIQVPTSLLAMVDAAIGGKTAVNHPKGKNAIGTIYQPALVVIDVDTLSTLPAREFRAGLAEVIKYRAIVREVVGTMTPMLASLPITISGIGRDSQLIRDLLAECVRAKLEVVVRDEREVGLRKLLNYGHTIGHALEVATSYRRYLHGEAVAVGMHAAACIAAEMGLVEAAFVEEQKGMIETAGLPLSLPADPKKVLAALTMDKKVTAGRPRWVLPASGGRMKIDVDVPDDLVVRAIQRAVTGRKAAAGVSTL